MVTSNKFYFGKHASNYLAFGLHLPYEEMRERALQGDDGYIDFKYDDEGSEEAFVKKIVTKVLQKFHLSYDEDFVEKEAREILYRYSNKHQIYLLQDQKDVDYFEGKGYGLYQIKLSKQDLIHLLEGDNCGLGDFSDEEYTHVIELDDEAKAYVRELKS